MRQLIGIFALEAIRQDGNTPGFSYDSDLYDFEKHEVSL